MFKDIKLGLKYFDYSINKKNLVRSCWLFLAIGFICEVASVFSYNATLDLIGSIYLLVCSNYIVQGILCLEYSTFVLAAPDHRRYVTTVISKITFLCNFLSLTVFNVIHFILISLNEDPLGAIGLKYSYLVIAVMVFVQSIYLMILYRHPIPGYLCMLLWFIPYTIGLVNPNAFLLVADIPVWALILATYLSLLIGTVLGYFISLKIYRSPIKERFLKAAMSKASKSK